MMLVVITGPMFSGKTTELIRRIERQMIAGRRVVIYKPTIDTRYHPSSVISHNGLKINALVVPPDEEGVKRIASEAINYDVIGIDEAQFFPPILADELNKLAIEKMIVVSALNLDFKGEPFETTMKLLAYADKVVSLTAVCKVCGKPATRTQRLINGKHAPRDSPRVLVGSSETYEARCRKHHIVP